MTLSSSDLLPELMEHLAEAPTEPARLMTKSPAGQRIHEGFGRVLE